MLKLYWRLILTQLKAQLQYPVAFWSELVGTALITTVEFGSVALILQRFEGIGGWSLGEVALLYGLIEAAFGVMDMLFSGFDPPIFGQQVRRGQLDQLLLRPVSLTLQVLGSRLEVRRLGRIVQGCVIFGAGLAFTPIRWTVVKLLLLPCVFGGQVLFFGGLFIVGSTITFWTVESIEAMNILTYGGKELISYPMHIYRDWLRRVFTLVIPTIFLNYYPVMYLLDKPDPFHLPPAVAFLAPLVGVATLAAALAFWRFGLKHYTSTGT
jgi:ABC-2 type transport system permease protein